ncbi:hypothetical protein E1181_00580 [Saccharopolyspora terrae]|jgi:hypothetical protein|uniref:Uncharacterized protein n=1 Tax=Saccharopolyspora terrae TaxID=2530384 RepID=A0A4R4W3R4_9PSEU|nr:hypothetical protein [Saccharopolyspora terrae]TDD10563.1 hypothetical protein E1181_00580 [Saccharopolyspora terrae]
MSIKRMSAAVLTTLCAAVAVPVLTAAPAQAWSWDCQEYLRGKGYNVPVGGEAADACTIAESGSSNALSICLSRLESLDVKYTHAKTGCKKGALK